MNYSDQTLELVMQAARNAIDDFDIDTPPTIRLVRSNVCKRLRTDGYPVRAPSYLLSEVGLAPGLHTAWPTSYALSILYERRHGVVL